MAAKLSGTPGLSGQPATPETQSKLQRVRAGAGEAISSLASYVPVNRVRNSSVLSYATFPVSSMYSFAVQFSKRVSESIWGKPKALADTIVVTIPGFFGGSSSIEPIERALRHGWATLAQVKAMGYTDEQIKGNGWLMIDIAGGVLSRNYQTTLKKAIEDGLITPADAIAAEHISVEQAKINGWVIMTANVPGRFFGSTPTQMLVRQAIEKGYISVAQAVKDGHFTKEHAEAATWIEKK